MNTADETVTLISHYHLNKVVARDFRQSRTIQCAKYTWIYISNGHIDDHSILSILNGIALLTPIETGNNKVNKYVTIWKSSCSRLCFSRRIIP